MIELTTNLICLKAKGITQLIFFTFFSRKGSQKITWYCFLGNWTKDITTGEKTCSLLSYIIWIYISRIYLHHVTKIFLSSAAPKSIIIKNMTSLWTSAKLFSYIYSRPLNVIIFIIDRISFMSSILCFESRFFYSDRKTYFVTYKNINWIVYFTETLEIYFWTKLRISNGNSLKKKEEISFSWS